MKENKFIPLDEYACRYKIGIDQLRKKIELNQVKFIFSNCEYLIKDEPFLGYEEEVSSYKGDRRIVEDQELYIENLKSQLEKTKLELENLKSEYEDLKNLIRFLEHENSNMQDTILGIKKIDRWLDQQK